MSRSLTILTPDGGLVATSFIKEAVIDSGEIIAQVSRSMIKVNSVLYYRILFFSWHESCGFINFLFYDYDYLLFNSTIVFIYQNKYILKLSIFNTLLIYSVIFTLQNNLKYYFTKKNLQHRSCVRNTDLKRNQRCCVRKAPHQSRKKGKRRSPQHYRPNRGLLHNHNSRTTCHLEIFQQRWFSLLLARFVS